MHLEARLYRACLLMAFAGKVYCQDNSSVAWDPREEFELRFDLPTILTGLGLALACCALWKLLIWFLERKRGINWNRARIVWPAAMVVSGWGIAGMFAIRESWGWTANLLFMIYAVVNFPALIAVAAALESVGQLTIWQRLAIGSIVMWVSWYLLVRLAEWRAWINIPTSLHLSNGVSSEHRISRDREIPNALPKN